eukprot:gene31329-6476_t
MDGYIQEEQIGKGSYGKVFKSKFDHEVLVMKKIAMEGTPAADTEASVREANLLALLRHPHIVPYREFFTHPDGDMCLVMAHCEGGDLHKHIKRLTRAEESVEEEIAWEWLVQLLLALSYCHSKKILHRDVKTQNIFISEGKVLLGDFGLAKQLQRTLEMARTPIGTPYYMAPEIYEEKPYSYKSDVWALGCVMYELLAKKAAFAADNLSRVVMRVIKGVYIPLPDDYSSDLCQVVNSMLTKDVANRPSANDLLQHPSVVPRVQRYLDSLSAANSNGWSTWRMKLPPTVLVQMANVIAQSRKSWAGSNVPTQAGGNRTSGSGAEEVSRKVSRIPQCIEDMMTSMEGFKREFSFSPFAFADGEENKFSELRVISHQLNKISAINKADHANDDEYNDDFDDYCEEEHFAPKDGHLNWTTGNTTSGGSCTATLKKHSLAKGKGPGLAKSSTDIDQLSSGLPAAGFGFGGGSGKSFTTPVATSTKRPAPSTPNTPSSAPSPSSASSSASPAPTTLSSISTRKTNGSTPSSAEGTPRATGYLPPLGTRLYKDMSPESLGRQARASAEFNSLHSATHRPPSSTRLAPDGRRQLNTFSLGHVSLQETLRNRGVWLRTELREQLGEKVLEAALRMISDLQC